MSQDKGPLERQKNEGDKPFEAFQIYMNLGFTRTIRKVADQLQKSYTLINRWRHEYNWDERLVEYDRELAEEAKKAAISKYRKLYSEAIETRLKLASALKVAALKSLQGYNESNQVSVEDSLTLIDKAFAIDAAVYKEMLGINSVGAVQIEGDTVTNNLLEAILAGTQEAIDTSDIPELEQKAVHSNDVVESPELEEQ